MPLEKDQLIQVGSKIYYLDSRRVNSTNVSGVYLVIGDGITLIETATTLIAPRVVEAAAEIGFKEADIRRAIVTHVHLDHAGGTGWLVNRLPQMKVYVHERGLRHLHDPSRLIHSATAVYGGIDRLTAIHGETLPVPMENLVPVTDANIDVGGDIDLAFISAPGHASHHLCVFEPESGCLFSGEALGHNHPETGVLQPAVAPPGFDFEASKETIGKLRKLNPRTICFSQFGQRHDASFVIEEAEQQLERYHRLILTRLKQGLETRRIVDEVADLYLEKLLNLELQGTEDHRGFLRSMLSSIVLGYETYFRRSGQLS
jgi:glyoxylase-like metal-dependent hydrolase (beta-lactamase superfamily II)